MILRMFQIMPLRAVVNAAICAAMLGQLAGCSHQDNPPAPTNAVVPMPAAPAASQPRESSNNVFARCAPEPKTNPDFVPTFQIAERYNQVAVQMKVRFIVDSDGFVLNAYLQGGNVVSSSDQEAGLDYVRHLTFEAPDSEECKPLKIQMVGTFHMAKDSSGDWITVFDSHPVYSLNGNQVVVNPN